MGGHGRDNVKMVTVSAWRDWKSYTNKLSQNRRCSLFLRLQVLRMILMKIQVVWSMKLLGWCIGEDISKVIAASIFKINQEVSKS